MQAFSEKVRLNLETAVIRFTGVLGCGRDMSRKADKEDGEADEKNRSWWEQTSGLGFDRRMNWSTKELKQKRGDHSATNIRKVANV